MQHKTALNLAFALRLSNGLGGYETCVSPVHDGLNPQWAFRVVGDVMVLPRTHNVVTCCIDGACPSATPVLCYVRIRLAFSSKGF
jgi:hypothetical protein